MRRDYSFCIIVWYYWFSKIVGFVFVYNNVEKIRRVVYEIYMGGCKVLSLVFDQVLGFYVLITA